MTDRLQANMAAAKMLGLSPTYIRCPAKVYVGFDSSKREFDIFTNPSDCLAAQQKLWERGLSVCSSPNGPENTIDYFIWDESNQTHFACIKEQTPQDALGAACIEVMK